MAAARWWRRYCCCQRSGTTLAGSSRPVGLQLGLVVGQGQVGGRWLVAGPVDMGRAEVADFLRSTHS
jgi:hypothetical protein